MLFELFFSDEIIKNLEPNQAVLVVDYKNKFIPLTQLESSESYFGK